MTGKGHRAVPPPAGYQVEPALTGQGLVVTVVNHDRRAKAFDFATLPVPGPMQRSLASVFAEQSRRWNSHLSAVTYWDKLLIFARFLSECEGPPADLDAVSAAMLKRWRAKNIGSNTGRNTLSAVRTLLRRDRRLQAGAVAEELARRVPQPARSNQAYDETEREQVRLAARQQFRAALARVRTKLRPAGTMAGRGAASGQQPAAYR
jgi:hypothetical protein